MMESTRDLSTSNYSSGSRKNRGSRGKQDRQASSPESSPARRPLEEASRPPVSGALPRQSSGTLGEWLASGDVLNLTQAASTAGGVLIIAAAAAGRYAYEAAPSQQTLHTVASNATDMVGSRVVPWLPKIPKPNPLDAIRGMLGKGATLVRNSFGFHGPTADSPGRPDAAPLPTAFSDPEVLVHTRTPFQIEEDWVDIAPSASTAPPCKEIGE